MDKHSPILLEELKKGMVVPCDGEAELNRPNPDPGNDA